MHPALSHFPCLLHVTVDSRDLASEKLSVSAFVLLQCNDSLRSRTEDSEPKEDLMLVNASTSMESMQQKHHLWKLQMGASWYPNCFKLLPLPVSNCSGEKPFSTLNLHRASSLSRTLTANFVGWWTIESASDDSYDGYDYDSDSSDFRTILWWSTLQAAIVLLVSSTGFNQVLG